MGKINATLQTCDTTTIEPTDMLAFESPSDDIVKAMNQGAETKWGDKRRKREDWLFPAEGYRKGPDGYWVRDGKGRRRV